ncbi:MAG: hypothetical protein U0M02_08210 [Acutalibacteraceae bacterium]|nr:hypothetical protein [Acutalibacteraceae bacterium]
MISEKVAVAVVEKDKATVTELMKNAGHKVSSAHGFATKIYGVNPSRLSQEPQTNPLSADSPRHFADGTYESVIVGYYTSAEVYPPVARSVYTK